MSQFKRQHPVSAFSRVFAIVKDNIITLIVILFVGKRSTDDLSNLLGIILVAVGLLLFSFVSWWRYRYRLSDGELNIEQGVIFRKKQFIPRERIQVVDTTSGFLQRMFGLVSLKIRTASGEGGATLSALTKEEAERITEALQTDEIEPDDTGSTTAYEDVIRTITYKELILTAATSGSIGVIATILGSVSSELDTLFSETQIYNFIEGLVGSGWQMVLLLVVSISLMAIIFAFLGTLIKYARFSIRRLEDTLVIRRGLIEQKTISIPLDRIQAITIGESPLRQLIARASVMVSSAGYGDENGQVTTLFPLLKMNELHHFIQEMVPEFAVSSTTVKPPGYAVRRYVVKMLIITFVISLLLFLFTNTLWVFLLLIPGAIWGYFQYRSTAVGLKGECLIARYRHFSQKTVILKKNRVQAASLRQTFLQKSKNLGNLSIHFASGKSGQTVTLRELDLDTGRDIQYWVGTGQYKQAENELLNGPILISTQKT